MIISMQAFFPYSPTRLSCQAKRCCRQSFLQKKKKNTTVHASSFESRLYIHSSDVQLSRKFPQAMQKRLFLRALPQPQPKQTRPHTKSSKSASPYPFFPRPHFRKGGEAVPCFLRRRSSITVAVEPQLCRGSGRPSSTQR